MRIVSGRWGGRVLKAPKGENTRPTMDAHRETLFNILVHRGLLPENEDGVVIVDLFSGTGALSLEALSRIENINNSTVLFFEKDKAAQKVLEQNVQDLIKDEMKLHYEIISQDFIDNWGSQILSRSQLLKGGIDLIFCDPPYRKNLASKAISFLEPAFMKNGILGKQAVLVVETEKDLKSEDLVKKLPRWDLLVQKTMGITQFLVFKRSA